MKLRNFLVFLIGVIIGQSGFSLFVRAQQDVPVPRSKPPQSSAQFPAPEVRYSNIEENKPGHAEKCKAELNAAGASYNWVGVATEGSCSIADAVELLSVDTGVNLIKFQQKPVMACDFAALFGRWTREIAGPVMAAYTGEQLGAVVTGPGIVCRNRVGGANTKISEHAKGNAIDVTAFRLSGNRTIRIGGELKGPEKRALKALRTSACGYFTTVLGPGANSTHNQHFHLDYAKRGKSYNYRICE